MSGRSGRTAHSARRAVPRPAILGGVEGFGAGPIPDTGPLGHDHSGAPPSNGHHPPGGSGAPGGQLPPGYVWKPPTAPVHTKKPPRPHVHKPKEPHVTKPPAPHTHKPPHTPHPKKPPKGHKPPHSGGGAHTHHPHPTAKHPGHYTGDGQAYVDPINPGNDRDFYGHRFDGQANSGETSYGAILAAEKRHRAKLGKLDPSHYPPGSIIFSDGSYTDSAGHFHPSPDNPTETVPGNPKPKHPHHARAKHPPAPPHHHVAAEPRTLPVSALIGRSSSVPRAHRYPDPGAHRTR